MQPEQRFHRLLQFVEGEGRRHQLEGDRTILDLGAQPAHGRGQNAPMVELHRPAELRRLAFEEMLSVRAPVARRFEKQPCAVEKLVALQRLLVVPGDPIHAEAEPHPVAPLAAREFLR